MSNETMGGRIRNLRTSKGLTQGELAKIIGCTQRAISHIETGGSMGATSTVIALVGALDTTASYLLFGVGPASVGDSHAA